MLKENSTLGVYFRSSSPRILKCFSDSFSPFDGMHPAGQWMRYPVEPDTLIISFLHLTHAEVQRLMP